LLGGHGFVPGLVPGAPGVALPDPDVLDVPEVPGVFTQGVVVPFGFVDPGAISGEVDGAVAPGVVAFGDSGVPVCEGEVVGEVVLGEAGVDPGTGVVVAPGVVLGVEVVPGVVEGVDVVPGACVVFGVCGVVLCGMVLCDVPAGAPAALGVVCGVVALGLTPDCGVAVLELGDELCAGDPLLDPVDCGSNAVRKLAANITPSP